MNKTPMYTHVIVFNQETTKMYPSVTCIIIILDINPEK